ncbi:MAG: bifunctional diaminohydroxyphosphoribosylaminopyrimidine deaminase/5-amino-6-(5-phosphoribosylamino)uracil reductase RibD [Marinifilaceae bacterium]
MEHSQYMLKAIELAKEGIGGVNPNPLVGALVVKNGEIIAQGYHPRYGEWHAERHALNECGEEARGATLYVTLEPCCHHGKTPPCTDIIIEKGISKVVIGILDPNPLVAGQGVAILERAGIEVITGVQQEAINHLNRVFLKYITTQMPWVLLKTAMTLDGKIATYTGQSRWVTSSEARDRVQELRKEYPAIMVGIGTVLADDPMLTCRLDQDARQPIRIVVDTTARIPVHSQLVQTAKEYPTIIAHTSLATNDALEHLSQFGVECMCCPDRNGEVDIPEMLRLLGQRKIDAILLEGGGTLNFAFLQHNCIDEVYAFVAPKLIGGKDAKTPVEGEGFPHMGNAISLTEISVEQVGEDILIKGLIDTK